MTDEELRRLVVDFGYTDQQLAEVLGVKVRSAARRRLRAKVYRQPDRSYAPRKTEAEIAQMKALVDEGYSFAAIIQILGVDRKTLQRHFPGRAWSQQKSIQHATSVRKGMQAVDRVWG